MAHDIKKYQFKAEFDLQIELMSLATLTEVSKEHVFLPHRTDFYHIFLFENCSPTHIVDFIPINIQPESLLFIDKDRVHQFDETAHYEGTLLIFTDNFFCTTDSSVKFLRNIILFNDLLDNPNIKIDSLLEKFQTLFRLMEEELQTPTDAAKHDIVKNLLHNFLLLADREKRKQGISEMKKGTDLDYTLLFRDLVEQHFTQIKSVSVYAAKLHVSEKRLNQAITKILGKTPKALIDERILLEAKRLLIYAHNSIKEIGFTLGFEDPAYFIKYFRKHTSKTPVEFRQQYLQ
jgi:AraC-like DNA-binding protein